MNMWNKNKINKKIRKKRAYALRIADKFVKVQDTTKNLSIPYRILYLRISDKNKKECER